MERLYTVLSKLHFLAFNGFFIIIVPILYVYTLHKVEALLVMLLTRKLMAKWSDKEISLNNNNDKGDISHA